MCPRQPSPKFLLDLLIAYCLMVLFDCIVVFFIPQNGPNVISSRRKPVWIISGGPAPNSSGCSQCGGSKSEHPIACTATHLLSARGAPHGRTAGSYSSRCR